MRRVRIALNQKVANAQSILSVLILSATLDATGPDEERAAQALNEVFESAEE